MYQNPRAGRDGLEVAGRLSASRGAGLVPLLRLATVFGPCPCPLEKPRSHRRPIRRTFCDAVAKPPELGEVVCGAKAEAMVEEVVEDDRNRQNAPRGRAQPALIPCEHKEERGGLHSRIAGVVIQGERFLAASKKPAG